VTVEVRSPRHSYSLLAVASLSAIYAVLYLAVFVSYTWAPLLLVALAPLALAVVGAKNGATGIAVVTMASAVLWFCGNQFFATYNAVAVLALSLLHAAIIGACAVALRWWHRATGWPLALLLPVTFVAGEYLRLAGPLGVPTGLIALGFHPHLWMIQIADLGGIYLVSFAVVAVNGAIADLVLGTGWARRSIVAVALLWLGIAGYGNYRLAQSRTTMQPGPVIGVIQPDIPMTGDIAHGFDARQFLGEVLAFSDQSAANQPRPELIVWPETMAVVPPLNREWLEAEGARGELAAQSGEFEQALREWTTRSGVPLLVGTGAVLPGSDRSHEPLVYNSAIRFDPGSGQFSQRQDKQRLFPLSESIPWAGTPLHDWINRWIASHATLPALGWYTRGAQRNVFALASSGGPSFHYAISMCVELCYAESCGTFLGNAQGGKAADFFVNMSNDGIFQRNRAEVWHASMSAFRAVEARVGIARSSNTGISGFVKPTGQMYGEVVNARGQSWTGMGAPELPRIAALVKYRQDHADEITRDPAVAKKVQDEIAAIEALRREAGVSGQSTQTVYIDSRRTLYSRIGDCFAWTLVALTLFGFFLPLFHLRKRAPSTNQRSAAWLKR
jgi:apolipoprotein N-acyltransferase